MPPPPPLLSVSWLHIKSHAHISTSPRYLVTMYQTYHLRHVKGICIVRCIPFLFVSSKKMCVYACIFPPEASPQKKNHPPLPGLADFCGNTRKHQVATGKYLLVDILFGGRPVGLQARLCHFVYCLLEAQAHCSLDILGPKVRFFSATSSLKSCSSTKSPITRLTFHLVFWDDKCVGVTVITWTCFAIHPSPTDKSEEAHTK
jgi:hypothetical protein